jgi:hypothetical protein
VSDGRTAAQEGDSTTAAQEDGENTAATVEVASITTGWSRCDVPAEVTWQLIGYSFVPLVLGAGVLFLALRVARRWRWRAPALTVGVLLLCYWAVILFSAVYPTIHQTDGQPTCVREEADGQLVEIDCSELEE